MIFLPTFSTRRGTQQQRGVSLIVVLLILVIVSILGAGGAQIAMMAERGARNDRDMQVAWQAAESALIDAEFDIHGISNIVSSMRQKKVFANMSDENAFVLGCGNDTPSPTSNKGLCRLDDNSTATPAWLTVDFTVTGNGAKSVAFGDFTGREFAASSSGTLIGVQPAQAPRYIIEAIVDPWIDRDQKYQKPSFQYVYRVTAMGFGPRPDIRAVSQIIYRD